MSDHLTDLPDEPYQLTEEDRLALEKFENERYLCPCGSGLHKEQQFDGYGIFLCYTCEECEKEKMGRYRPDIHEHYECDEAIDED